MKELLCPAILLFLVCYADYNEIEGLPAGHDGSYQHSSEAVARDNRMYDILYFSDDDMVFEYVRYPDGTPAFGLLCPFGHLRYIVKSDAVAILDAHPLLVFKFSEDLYSYFSQKS